MYESKPFRIEKETPKEQQRGKTERSRVRILKNLNSKKDFRQDRYFQTFDLQRKKYQFQYEQYISRKIFRQDEIKKIINVVEEDRGLTGADFQRDQSQNTRNAGLSTIERVLKYLGLQSHRKRQMQEITDKNMKFKIRSFKNNLWIVKSLNEKVIYQDESQICSLKSGLQFVNKYDDENLSDPIFRRISRKRSLSFQNG